MQRIVPCLWFDNKAEEAVAFYQTVFKDTRKGAVTHYSENIEQTTKQKAGKVLTIDFTIEGLQVTALNAGSEFSFTPAISFFVLCENEAEINGLWEKLSQGGSPRMELGAYPWAKRYGWTADKFGVDWQLVLNDQKGFAKIVPSILFVNERYGRVKEAVKYYTGLFPNSGVVFESPTPDGKAVAHCRFKIDGQEVVIMEGEGKHDWDFSMAFSLMAFCKDQKEIDRYWDKIAGEGAPAPCGWATDKFGLAWQIVPERLLEFRKDPKVFARVMGAVVSMQKLDLATMEKAAQG